MNKNTTQNNHQNGYIFITKQSVHESLYIHSIPSPTHLYVMWEAGGCGNGERHHLFIHIRWGSNWENIRIRKSIVFKALSLEWEEAEAKWNWNCQYFFKWFISTAPALNAVYILYCHSRQSTNIPFTSKVICNIWHWNEMYAACM